MKRASLARVAALTAITTLTGATSASAFLCTRTSSDGPSVAWPVRSIELHRHGGSADVTDGDIDRSIAFAAQQWTAVGCSDFTLSLGDETDNAVAGFDWAAGSGSPPNQNIVVFRNDNPDDPVDRWLHTLSALAITTVTFVSTSGEILDADVEVNDAEFAFTACDPGLDCQRVDSDLENTLTHELGHVVGLDHPPATDPDAYSATMFASAPAGEIAKRDLSDDDIRGICLIYPSDGPNGECFGVTPEQPPNVRFTQTGCTATGLPTGTPLVTAVAGAFLTGLLCRRRRAAPRA